MSSEPDPPHPDEVAKAIADLAAGDERAPDPWWRAGIEESLEE